LVVGVVASTIFAVAADSLLVGAERRVTPWARRTGVRAVG
jgi:hypothetical protein